ncbi:MAG: zinc-dependent metalloprotease [Bryobacteraceae bacterium]
MKSILPLLLCLASAAAVPAQSPIAKKTEGMTRMPGFFPVYWDAKAGKLWLEINRWDKEFLYLSSLPAGVGSNDIGLDRGQLGEEKVVQFERSGPKILLVQSNYGFRALSGNTDEAKSVGEAFARSVLWGFQADTIDGDTALVDATAFYLRDAHDVPGTMRRTKQGAFKLEDSRSAIYMPRTKNFPNNTEVETTLTFLSDDPGNFVREVVPTPGAVTVREHHSFVQLPGPGFQPRAFDPRSGFFGIEFMDFASPIDQPIRKRYIARHRLLQGEAMKPLVYYLDRGAPEPVRSALLEGARWWNQAFEAAGFRDAFRVELLPEEADPMDVRYNVIQWVHRSSRGWSYGSTVTDPRTGEIIKGHVTLGSLRVRQDYLIAEGLLAPYESGKPASPEMKAMAIARMRQLAAHEVGHTLGLAHNYAASAAGHASVMDYPGPLAKLKGGRPDLTDAYATGIGEWDKVAITFGYGDQPGVLEKAQARGLYFITDSDSRPQGSAHPNSHLWDNGANAVDELNRIMEVRAKALARFGENNIREGAPMSSLEEALVPLYLSHRYQVEAASKVLGGLDYRYALRGDGQKIADIVPAAEQQRALQALLRTLDPQALTLPEKLLQQLPPRAFGYPRDRESFKARTGVTFDPMAAVESAAGITLAQILNPERAERLIQYHARDPKNPGLAEVIDKVITATWKRARVGGLSSETQRVVDDVALYQLMALAANDAAAAQARAIALSKIEDLKRFLNTPVSDPDQSAHYRFALAQIKRFEEDPRKMDFPKPAEPPPGQPI